MRQIKPHKEPVSTRGREVNDASGSVVHCGRKGTVFVSKRGSDRPSESLWGATCIEKQENVVRKGLRPNLEAALRKDKCSFRGWERVKDIITNHVKR